MTQHIYFFKLQLQSAFWCFQTVTVSECCLIKLHPYVWKTILIFSIKNGQPREPALCQLYRHSFVRSLWRCAHDTPRSTSKRSVGGGVSCSTRAAWCHLSPWCLCPCAISGLRSRECPPPGRRTFPLPRLFPVDYRRGHLPLWFRGTALPGGVGLHCE